MKVDTSGEQTAGTSLSLAFSSHLCQCLFFCARRISTSLPPVPYHNPHRQHPTYTRPLPAWRFRLFWFIVVRYV